LFDNVVVEPDIVVPVDGTTLTPSTGPLVLLTYVNGIVNDVAPIVTVPIVTAESGAALVIVIAVDVIT
jgi:hypothetical protein